MTDSLPMGSLSPYCSNGHGCCGMGAVAQGVQITLNQVPDSTSNAHWLRGQSQLMGMQAAAATMMTANLHPPATMQLCTWAVAQEGKFSFIRN